MYRKEKGLGCRVPNLTLGFYVFAINHQPSTLNFFF